MALPTPETRGEQKSFFRIAWPLLAVFQVLEGYPVARTDAVFSVVPIAVVACVCLSDYVHSLPRAFRGATLPATLQKVGTAAVLILLLVANASTLALVQHRLY